MVLFAGVTVLFVAALGAGFYLRGKALMEEQLRQKLRDTAAVAVQQLDAEVVAGIHGIRDLQNLNVVRVVKQLNRIRDGISSIRFVYIMRRTPDPMLLEFVADADSLATPAELDVNGNGTVDEDEEASYPGDHYDITDILALQSAAFLEPVVDTEITQDQWGAFISGYAPVLDADGNAVAILGIDMDAAEFLHLTRSMFSPVAFLLILVTAVLFAGYVFLFLWNRRVETLKRLDDERSAILTLTSHQLGTPLTVFKWTLETLRESAERGKLDEDFAEEAEHLQTGVAQLQSVVEELLRASRIQEGKFAYVPKQTYLRNVLVEVVHAMGKELAERQQTIDLQADGNMRLALDKGLIGGVVQELLRNAIVFSRPQSVIYLSAWRKGKEALVEVRDNGCGIASADLPRVFGKFVRGNNAHLSRTNGNGLGLFIAKTVVEKAGGRIWLKSVEGKGTSVVFALPIGAE